MNVQAENGLIGAIILNNDVIDEIPFLQSDMLDDELNRECFKTAKAYREQGKPIDTTILAAQLEDVGQTQETIISHLMECVQNAPNDRHGAKEYATIIVSDYKSNRLRKLTSNFSLLPSNVDAEITKLADAIEDINAQTTISQSRSIADIVRENKSTYFTKREIKGVRTGFYRLDEALFSLEPGDVTVIGARPSVGKSAFSTQMILQIASTGKRVGYFNLEMSESQVYVRMLAFCSRIEMGRIKQASGFSDEQEQRHFEKANEVLSNFQIFVTSRATTVSQIRAISKREKYDVIVIDYLQLVKPDRIYNNRVAEVGDISKSIKALAMELEVPIILLSQLNRTSEGRETKEPSMAELRETGDIEQDASNVLLLWNVSSKDDRYKALKIDKNRQGQRGVYIGMEFKGSLMCFVERNEEYAKYLQMVKNMEKSIEDLNNYCATDEEDAEELFN